MTKLLEWLFAFTAILSLWFALVTNKIESEFTRQYQFVILLSPAIFVVLFGLYATAVVLYRVYIFNDCEDAADELKKEIKMARDDLKKKGFVF